MTVIITVIVTVMVDMAMDMDTAPTAMEVIMMKSIATKSPNAGNYCNIHDR